MTDATPSTSEPTTAGPAPTPGEAALQRLREGNRRFVEGRSVHRHESAAWRSHLVAAQAPFATILGCADSRIPPELIFDQGFGDLFVIRVAGNVVGEEVAGSLQYAVHHLRTPLFVVMGHDGCGAVTAALAERDGQATEPRFIEALIGLIRPALARLDPALAGPDRLQAAVEANVRLTVARLSASPEGRKLVLEQQGLLAGAVYELETGAVRFLDSPGPAHAG